MINHKIAKNQVCLGRLKCFDGYPVSMNAKKKMYIPDALKAVKLAPRARYSVLGNIAKECGWTKQQLIDELETKRVEKNHEWYINKTKTEKDITAITIRIKEICKESIPNADNFLTNILITPQKIPAAMTAITGFALLIIFFLSFLLLTYNLYHIFLLFLSIISAMSSTGLSA